MISRLEQAIAALTFKHSDLFDREQFIRNTIIRMEFIHRPILNLRIKIGQLKTV